MCIISTTKWLSDYDDYLLLVGPILLTGTDTDRNREHESVLDSHQTCHTLFSGLRISPNTAVDLMCLLNENQGQDLHMTLEPKCSALHFYFCHLNMNINNALLGILIGFLINLCRWERDWENVVLSFYIVMETKRQICLPGVLLLITGNYLWLLSSEAVTPWTKLCVCVLRMCPQAYFAILQQLWVIWIPPHCFLWKTLWRDRVTPSLK